MEGFEEEGNLHLIDYLNTYNPTLRVIMSKGYRIFLFPDHREEFYGDYWAIKGNRKIVAADPLRLLGLISMWETYGDGWYGKSDKTSYEHRNLFDEIAARAFPNNPEEIESLSNEEFNDYVSDYRLFFNSFTSKEILPQNVSRKDFYTIIDNFYKWDPEGFYEFEK
ncbi:hypothetical protein HYN59_13075 [Flavobacterium album]|uniref:Uncharacterized protein n=1 Tax=Flavobacterium album TaxID=2175091 RepID=A0A2S1QZY3_9FLAO|nr:hypothetical protein [Flavobacterium album]AWH85982.1 hypothetical protein HYN59_13075 [Flavobacterium album]